MTLTPRPYTSADFMAVTEMWHYSKRAAFPYVALQQEYDIARNRGYFQHEIVPNYQLWVAEMTGQIVGFMAYKPTYIDQLFVHLSYQGQGVGTALLNHAKAISPQGLQLYTFEKNHVARQFYEQNGFRAIKFGVSPAPESEPDVLYEWKPKKTIDEGVES
ncbi:GNAT family N-acetyltransferase [Anaerolineales bacterium HSG25]|nr:GNAT family N-acetyltransferase [Anaerolineales bacterium HSG25]